MSYGALIRDKATGRPRFDNPETVKLFWDAKDKHGKPMLSEEDKTFLRTQHGLDARGRTKKPETFVRVDSPDAAKAVWKYLTPEQKKILREQWKELKDVSDV